MGVLYFNKAIKFLQMLGKSAENGTRACSKSNSSEIRNEMKLHVALTQFDFIFYFVTVKSKPIRAVFLHFNKRITELIKS